jgi:hypothetical protein
VSGSNFMDIPVSRLNNRMAVQLPAELPLGLVFVVGAVQQLQGNGNGQAGFYLSEGDFQLRCRLSERANQEVRIKEGSRIRAGGHLAFDPQRAEYYLLARDVEIIEEVAAAATGGARTPMAPILADITRRAKAASLTPATLPAWVKDMAPPEMQPQLTGAPADEKEDDDWRTVDWETGDDGPMETTTAVAAPTAPDNDFNNELITFLSAAMDQDDDVELTSDLLAELAPQIKPGKNQFRVAQPYDISQREPERVHWAIAAAVLLILMLVLLFVAYLIYGSGII